MYNRVGANWLKSSEVAERLGCTVQHVYYLIRENLIPKKSYLLKPVRGGKLVHRYVALEWVNANIELYRKNDAPEKAPRKRKASRKTQEAIPAVTEPAIYFSE